MVHTIYPQPTTDRHHKKTRHKKTVFSHRGHRAHRERQVLATGYFRGDNIL